MAEDKKKKEKNIDELVSEFEEMRGKPFKERIKKFEELHDEEKAHMARAGLHAEYVVFGKPSDLKGYPGAYSEAYKVLDKAVEEDIGKVEDISKLTEILEKYVDTFLEKAMREKFKKHMEAAEKEGLSKEDIRKIKGRLFANYHRDEKGNPIDILDESYVRELKGKRKIDLIQQLKTIAQASKKTYSQFLIGRMTSPLMDEYDITEMHEYITPLFKKAGFEPEEHHLTKAAPELYGAYATLLRGGDISKLGYKRLKEEKEGEDKKKKKDEDK